MRVPKNSRLATNEGGRREWQYDDFGRRTGLSGKHEHDPTAKVDSESKERASKLPGTRQEN